MPSNSTNVCKFINVGGIIRSSNVKVAEGLRPKRIVLRHLENREEFVVHAEYLDIGIEDRTVDGVQMSVAVFTSSAFDPGDYFNYGQFSGQSKEQALEKATARYEERSRGFSY